jgi:hypothetical protein
MASTRQMRAWWHLDRCTPGIKKGDGFFGRTPIYAANTDIIDCWKALEQAHFAAGYVPTPGGFIGSKRRCPTGIAGKTCQENGDNCSLHNYCLALDVEYNHNPHFKRRLSRMDLLNLYTRGKTKYSPAILDSILQVKNLQGEQLFRNLSYTIGDTMHWQINVPPERAKVDWSTVGDGTAPVPPPTERNNMYLPLVYTDGFDTNPDRKEDVFWLQKALNRVGGIIIAEDGKYGNEVAAAIRTISPGTDGRIYGAKEHDILLGLAYSGEVGFVSHTHTGDSGTPT